jgi:hypothetical protein
VMKGLIAKRGCLHNRTNKVILNAGERHDDYGTFYQFYDVTACNEGNILIVNEE